MNVDEQMMRGSLLTFEAQLWEARAAVCRERRWKNARAGKMHETAQDEAIEVGLARVNARRMARRALLWVGNWRKVCRRPSHY